MDIVVSISSIVDHVKVLGLSDDDIEKIFVDIISSVLENPQVKDLSEFKNLYEAKYEELEADLYICNDDEIKRLNNEYRNIDAPTDVLSFAMQEDSEPFDLPIAHLGEIIISVDKLVEQAAENSHSNLYEFLFLLSHGVLHLFGVHHDTDENYETVVKIQQNIAKLLLEKLESK